MVKAARGNVKSAFVETAAPRDIDAVREALEDNARTTEKIGTVIGQLSVEVQGISEFLQSAFDRQAVLLLQLQASLEESQKLMKRDIEFLLASYQLQDEERSRLEAYALQTGQSMGECLSRIISERIAVGVKAVALILPDDLSSSVRERAEFNDCTELDIVKNALYFSLENQAFLS